VRESIEELEDEILEIVGRTFSTIEFKHRKNAHFILTEKYGISDDKLKKLQELCKKEDMEFYISTKFFTNRITICLSEKPYK
jgi:tRNA pseudouridine-54 N-methylase